MALLPVVHPSFTSRPSHLWRECLEHVHIHAAFRQMFLTDVNQTSSPVGGRGDGRGRSGAFWMEPGVPGKRVWR